MTKGSLKYIVIGCIGLALLGVLISVFAGRQKSVPATDQPKSGIAIAVTIAPVIAKSDQSATLVPQAATKSTGVNGQIEAEAQQVCSDRLIEVKIGATTTVTCKLNENLSGDQLVDGVIGDLQSLTQAVMQHEDVQTLRLEVIGQIKDKNGTSSDGVVFGFSIPKALYTRVSSKNLVQRDFAQFITNGTDGSKATINPALRAAWQAYLPD